MLSIGWLKCNSKPIDLASRLRILLLVCTFGATHHPFHMLAGHDMMVHLAIYNDGPFNTDSVPAVFGVPLPASDDPVDPKDLILVGAKSWQIKPLSHWPNGSIRWMLVEAIVEVQSNQDRAAYHLTTGEPPKDEVLIATEIANGFQMDSGKSLVRITGNDPVICHVESKENDSPTDFSFQLNQNENQLGKLQNRELVLENNGPVTATISLIETYVYQDQSKITFRRNCEIFKDRKGFTIESIMYRHPGGLKSIPLTFPTLTSHTEESKNIQVRKHGLSEAHSDQTVQMVPGSMNRMWHFINFKSSETPPFQLRPYLGRAISINTYNDAFCTEAYIISGNGDALLDLNEQVFSRSKAAQLIRDVMGGDLLPTPKNVQTLSEYLGNWVPEIDSSHLSGSPDAEIAMDSMAYEDAWRIPSLWYFMTGETIFKDLRLYDVENQYAEAGGLRDYHRLWDAYLLNGSLDLRDFIETKMSRYFVGYARNLETGRKDRHLIRMAANLIHQGGLNQKDYDKWLDGLETFVHQTSELNDLSFAEGFRLTGENKYLKEGKQWLEQTFDEIPVTDAISGLIQNIQRQHVWRWLELTATDIGKDGWELSWKAPQNAVRYRFKQFTREITNLPIAEKEDTTIPFYVVENLDLNIAPAAPGTLQSIKIDRSKSGSNSYFAMRYLERGPDLPALKTLPVQTATPPSTTQTNSATPKTYSNIIFIGVMVVGLGMALIFWKKSI